MSFNIAKLSAADAARYSVRTRGGAVPKEFIEAANVAAVGDKFRVTFAEEADRASTRRNFRRALNPKNLDANFATADEAVKVKDDKTGEMVDAIELGLVVEIKELESKESRQARRDARKAAKAAEEAGKAPSPTEARTTPKK